MRQPGWAQGLSLGRFAFTLRAAPVCRLSESTSSKLSLDMRRRLGRAACSQLLFLLATSDRLWLGGGPSASTGPLCSLLTHSEHDLDDLASQRRRGSPLSRDVCNDPPSTARALASADRRDTDQAQPSHTQRESKLCRARPRPPRPSSSAPCPARSPTAAACPAARSLPPRPRTRRADAGSRRAPVPALRREFRKQSWVATSICPSETPAERRPGHH